MLCEKGLVMRHWPIALVGFSFLAALSFAGYRHVGADGTQGPKTGTIKKNPPEWL